MLAIRYDCEDEFYSFNFFDFKKSVAKLTSIMLTVLLGKIIRERFTNIEENFLMGLSINVN